MKRFRRFSRRRSRRKPADILNFSIAGQIDALVASSTIPNFNSTAPYKSITPLCLGGQQGFSQGAPNVVSGSQLGLFLSDRAERGGTVGGFRFKHFHLIGAHINAETDAVLVFSDVVYNAIVKMEYDLDQYRSTGTVATADIPNIIHSTVTSFGATFISQPLSDLNCDVLWRDIAVGQSVAADAATDPLGNLVQTEDVSNNQLWAWSKTNPWSVIRTKRRLKEDEGLFWVTNIVSGQPSFQSGVAQYQHLVTQYVYGVMAARIR